MMSAYEALRPVLFALPPEVAHRLAVVALKNAPSAVPTLDPRLAHSVLGLTFPSPIGLAAGFDKNGEAFAGALGLGFGFTEIGTLTPLPQKGNPQPRLFRLVEDNALINRLGFNNDGAVEAYKRLSAWSRQGIVGVNVGANKDSPDRINDYVTGVIRFADLASYLVINISSPNTAGLRDLQGKAALGELLLRVKAARDEARRGRSRVPLVVKLAPDLSDSELADIAEIVIASGIDGAIMGNTTIGRPGLKSALAGEAGGLSGVPLFRLSTIKLARLRKLVGPGFPLIGVGGIDSGERAWAKLAAGADLVQLYTGMVYRGPTLAGEINRDLLRRMDSLGVKSLDRIVASEVDAWAEREPL